MIVHFSACREFQAVMPIPTFQTSSNTNALLVAQLHSVLWLLRDLEGTTGISASTQALTSSYPGSEHTSIRDERDLPLLAALTIPECGCCSCGRGNLAGVP